MAGRPSSETLFGKSGSVQETVQRGTRDLQSPCGFDTISAGLPQSFTDGDDIQLAPAWMYLRGDVRRPLLWRDYGSAHGWKMTGQNHLVPALDQGKLEPVLKLPDVSGPIIGHHDVERFVRDCNVLSPEIGERSAEDMIRQ